MEPRSDSQDRNLLNASTKEVSLEPLSPVAKERKLACGRTPLYLKRKIKEMEMKMDRNRMHSLTFERDLARHSQQLSERQTANWKEIIDDYCRDYEEFEQRRNQYQRRLMRERSN